MNKLCFKNGEFRILVLSDAHECFTNPVKHRDLIRFIEKSILFSKPDLIVFNGDNATARTRILQRAAINSIIKPVSNAQIPFVVVFGNHDDQYCKMSKLEQLKLYQAQGICHSVKGNCFTGVCNFNLPIFDDKSNRILFNLWFFDSNTYDSENGGYAYVTTDQLDWYEKTARSLADENGGIVKSILFQHIPVPEEYEMLKKCDENTTGAVKGDCGYNGNYCIDDKNSTMEGVLLEGPCPPTVNNGEFQSWKKTGDITAAVFGHDHINTFSGLYDGITLMQAGGAGFNTYHRGTSQSASLIVIDKQTLDFRREHINFKDIIGVPLTYKFKKQ